MEVLQVPLSELVALCRQDPEMGLQVYMNVAQLFIDRYSDTMSHLALSVESELQDPSYTGLE